VASNTGTAPYPAGTELVLCLAPAAYCAEAAPRPSDGPPRFATARIARPVPGVLDVWWEDWLAPAGGDYDDLVVRVEALPARP
jgi:hypothetical protein